MILEKTVAFHAQHLQTFLMSNERENVLICNQKQSVVPHKQKSIVVKIDSPLDKRISPLNDSTNNDRKNCTKILLRCYVASLKFK